MMVSTEEQVPPRSLRGPHRSGQVRSPGDSARGRASTAARAHTSRSRTAARRRGEDLAKDCAGAEPDAPHVGESRRGARVHTGGSGRSAVTRKRPLPSERWTSDGAGFDLEEELRGHSLAATEVGRGSTSVLLGTDESINAHTAPREWRSCRNNRRPHRKRNRRTKHFPKFSPTAQMSKR